MNVEKRNLSGARILFLAILALPSMGLAAPSTAASHRFDLYVAALEQRHASVGNFCEIASADELARLHRGEMVIEQLTPRDTAANGAMLHDWRGTAFLTGGSAVEVARLMQDFAAYPQVYAPQILSAKLLARSGEHYQTLLRVRQHHVLTVVMDTAFDVSFSAPDPHRGFSLSRSSRIAEIASPGKPGEHALTPAEEHGYLWRLNTYWSWCEADGGVYMQVESISLTRDIPAGLGWLIGPFVQSVPRESLEFTLNATRNALRARSETRDDVSRRKALGLPRPSGSSNTAQSR